MPFILWISDCVRRDPAFSRHGHPAISTYGVVWLQEREKRNILRVALTDHFWENQWSWTLVWWRMPQLLSFFRNSSHHTSSICCSVQRGISCLPLRRLDYWPHTMCPRTSKLPSYLTWILAMPQRRPPLRFCGSRVLAASTIQLSSAFQVTSRHRYMIVVLCRFFLKTQTWMDKWRPRNAATCREKIRSFGIAFIFSVSVLWPGKTTRFEKRSVWWGDTLSDSVIFVVSHLRFAGNGTLCLWRAIYSILPSWGVCCTYHGGKSLPSDRQCPRTARGCCFWIRTKTHTWLLNPVLKRVRLCESPLI